MAVVTADLVWALSVAESCWSQETYPELGTALGILISISISVHYTAAEAQQHKLGTTLSPSLCDTWLFQPASSFECPTYLSAAPLYHRHPPAKAFWVLPHSCLSQFLWFHLAWLSEFSMLWILIFMSRVSSSHTKWMCAISDFSWPCFWLVCVFGKADIVPKLLK